MRCKRLIHIGLMPEARQCLRQASHSGYHTPDISGMIFGKINVLRFLGSPKSGKCVKWLVEIHGLERAIEARSLISGTSSGARLHQHGFRITPEYNSVMNHYGHITRSTSPQHKYYSGMPFCDDWNPKKNGDIWKGAKWIIDNLGSKPGDGWSLDIIEHAKGFVPGNLRWAEKGVQMRNQLHRFLEGVSDQQFAAEAKRRGYSKDSQ